jgi:hypothetical protein
MRCLKGSEGRAQGNALGGEVQFAPMVPEFSLFHRAGIPIPAPSQADADSGRQTLRSFDLMLETI